MWKHDFTIINVIVCALTGLMWIVQRHAAVTFVLWQPIASAGHCEANINCCPPIISLCNPYSIVHANQFSWKRSSLMNDDRISLLALILHKVICNVIVAHTFLSLLSWRRTYHFLSLIIYPTEASGLMSYSHTTYS